MMRYKLFAKLFTLLGFLCSLGLPILAANMQITVLRKDCGGSTLEKIGLTASGAVVIGFIVCVVFWKYFSHSFREKLRSHRTAFGFFFIGYFIVLAIKKLLATLELIFLFGVFGSALAIICFKISDKLKEKAVK